MRPGVFTMLTLAGLPLDERLLHLLLVRDASYGDCIFGTYAEVQESHEMEMRGLPASDVHVVRCVRAYTAAQVGSFQRSHL